MNDSPEYIHCLEMENDRERKWRKTAQGAFESAMLSMEQLNDSFDDPSKIYAFSDNGAGAWMIEHSDYLTKKVTDVKKKINAARMKIIRKGGKHLLDVFYLVLKNGTNWEQSVCELMKKRNARKAKAAKSTPPTKTSIGMPHTRSILHT